MENCALGMDYTQATPISDLDDLAEEMWDFWGDEMLCWVEAFGNVEMEWM